mmetsp:Transcript_406/g.447  ORF Transcript_406/g.447 Transcript_406/m.447 type:complete len:180 (+) Transcript_406:113-652(+)
MAIRVQYITQHLSLHQGLDIIPNFSRIANESCDCCEEKREPLCNACPFCADTCGNPSCQRCKNRSCSQNTAENPLLFVGSKSIKYYTMCQLRRHNTLQSAWILVGENIYDVTSYISKHPGGRTSILRRAGGKMDCSVDFEFHSKSARKLWRNYKIGKLCPCPGKHSKQSIGTEEPCSIM